MKNKAFTLAEVLITLGIVGVVAALTIPGIAKLKPDESKVKYMKVYNNLANLAPEILNDEAIFKTTYGNDGKVNCAGLLDTSEPSDRSAIDPIYFKDGVYTLQGGKLSQNATINGTSKFDYFLSRRLNLSKDFNYPGSGTVTTLTTSDGISWKFENEPNTFSGPTFELSPKFRKKITIDMNGDKTPNCTYSADCKRPDQFIFYVSIYGAVEPGDKLGKAFLMNSSDMHNIDKDRAKADSL